MNNTSEHLYENLNISERLNRNPEKLVARLCSEPQTGELVRESEKLRNLNSSLCPLVHTNETENMSSNSRESINLDQTEENLDVPSHMSDYLGTSKKSEQPSKRPIELVKTGEFVSHQRNQKSSVENSDYLSLNKENSGNYSIQRDSGMHSETFHSDKEDSEIQFEEIILNDGDDDLLRKNLQLKNKLVKSCPQTRVDDLRTAAEQKNEIRVHTCPQTSLDNFQLTEQRKNEKLSESCPKTTRDNIPLAEKEEIRKLSDSCPETTRGHISRAENKENGKLSKMCPRTTSGHICGQENEEKEKLSKMCPRTTSGHICRRKNEEKEKLSEMCPRTTLGHICGQDNKEKEKLSEMCPRTH